MPDREPRADRRRRHGGSRAKQQQQKPPESAARVIAAAKPAMDAAKHADVPLTPAEVAEMRVHLRFLKENRKTLALKVNAAEDLLLNGAREPSHRGVCQHLLDKVEKSRVELVAQRLDASSRIRLLEGIIRFSPDIGYLLLYLESLTDAARTEAVPALTAALRRIDFGEVSAAQMRRVLDLIVELTHERDRPQLLFSLLSSSTFQKAFDASAERLPEALSNIVVPLRAAHAVIVRGVPNPFDAEALARGTVMLLALPKSVLESQVPQVCRRLFEAGIDLAFDPRSAAGLRVLFDALPQGDRSRADAGLALARWLLARGLEKEAKAHFAALEKKGVEVPRPWAAALDGRRIGGIGLTERAPPEDSSRPERELFTNGVLLARQLPVWLRVGTAADAERYGKSVELAQSTALPGVARIVAHGVTAQGQPYFAVERHGRSANEVLLGKRGLDAVAALSVAAEANAIVGVLGLAGVKLPDARFRRFAIDDHGRLWLRDLTDAERSSDAAEHNTRIARELCLDLLARAPRLVVPGAVDAKLRQANSTVAIARAMEELV